MSAATDYLENKWIDHMFRARAYAPPAALWWALFTTATADAGTGTEVATGGYARVNLPPSDLNWYATQGGTIGPSTGNNGQTANAVPVTFPNPTADWGIVTHVAVFDAPVGGMMLAHGPLTTPRDIRAGDAAPAFAAGVLVVAFA